MNIKPSTHQWYTKTFAGWFVIHNVELTTEEKQIFQSDTPEKQSLIQKINNLAVKKIDSPPENVLAAFNQNYNQQELINANINDKGHGTIRTKQDHNYTKVNF